MNATTVKSGMLVSRLRRPANKKKLRVLYEDEQLVGSYVSRQVSEDLSLLAVYSNTSRSEIIRSLITTRLASENVNQMILALAERIFRSWQQYVIDRGEAALNFTQYRHHTREELRTKKISSVYIERIMRKAKELHETDRKAEFK